MISYTASQITVFKSDVAYIICTTRNPSLLVCWVVTPCERGGCIFLRNTGVHEQFHSAFQLTRPTSTFSPPLELQISKQIPSLIADYSPASCHEIILILSSYVMYFRIQIFCLFLVFPICVIFLSKWNLSNLSSSEYREMSTTRKIWQRRVSVAPAVWSETLHSSVGLEATSCNPCAYAHIY